MLFTQLASLRFAEVAHMQKKVVMISIMMQSRNAKCNVLKSVFGIFLHSTSTPEKVIQALAHMGVSVSTSAIHTAIHALSTETYETLQEMGQTLLAGYAYDNYDVDFKTVTPTIEKAGDTLTHLTSGTIIMLEHRVTQEDLKCSEELWNKSPLNPLLESTPPPCTCRDLLNLHPEVDHPSGLTHHQCYISGKFQSNLIEYGPIYFRKFSMSLPLVETIDQIPVVKMCYAPAHSMDVNESTHAGNIGAMSSLLDQGGVGDLKDQADHDRAKHKRSHGCKMVSILNYVVLFFGDLATFECLLGVLQHRAIEGMPWHHFQFVVFVMGLFHLKMACADAIWQIFIKPKHTREDANGLMAFVGLYRPHETGKIGSAPGFCRMHEVIQHNGIALRLDAWWTEVILQNPTWNSLDDLATSNPMEESIHEMANHLAAHYVAGGDMDIFSVWNKGATEQDEQNKNILLMHQYFLLYEEITYAMNQGDVGRLKTLFPPWISIFHATGKHKYAAHMTSFLTDIYFVYPEKLKYTRLSAQTRIALTSYHMNRHAVCYNMLVNPTGKPGKF